MKHVALVTGANRGIGFAIAKALAETHGYQVLLGCRDLELGADAAQRIQGKATPVHLPLQDPTKLQSAIAALQGNYPNIDTLVNNAGTLEDGNALEVDRALFDTSFQVNFFAPFDLIRAFAPTMIENGYGRIVNLSSGWGAFSDGLEGPAAYSITKAALNALTLNLARDLPPYVKMNTMCPGWVRTRMGGDAAPRSPEEGADTAVWLATLPPEGPSGRFFRDRQEIEW